MGTFKTKKCDGLGGAERFAGDIPPKTYDGIVIMHINARTVVSTDGQSTKKRLIRNTPWHREIPRPPIAKRWDIKYFCNQFRRRRKNRCRVEGWEFDIPFV